MNKDRASALELIAKALVKKIDEPPAHNKHPKNLNDILFQHHSPYELSFIIPQTYKNIEKQRLDGLSKKDAAAYVNDRINEEKKYKAKLKLTDNKKSFTYASVVGFNLMEDPLDYPGFTYYFHLDKQQVENTLFGIVGVTQHHVEPAKGLLALQKCLYLWNKYENEFEGYEDEILGPIEPRIEVIIPYVIVPEFVIVEIEQR